MSLRNSLQYLTMTLTFVMFFRQKYMTLYIRTIYYLYSIFIYKNYRLYTVSFHFSACILWVIFIFIVRNKCDSKINKLQVYLYWLNQIFENVNQRQTITCISQYFLWSILAMMSNCFVIDDTTRFTLKLNWSL